MTLPALATTDDMAAMLQRDLLPGELTYANRLLQVASDMVRRYCRQNISQTLGDVITLPGVWGQTLRLPQRPVTNVTSVVINGATQPFAAWQLVSDDELFIGTGSYQPDYGSSLYGGPGLWGPAGSDHGPQATGTTWQGPQAKITVTYDHGYATIPGDVVNEVAGMAALQMSSPVGVEQERIGGYQVKYAQSPVGGMVLTPETMAVLNFYRRRAASPSIAPRR